MLRYSGSWAAYQRPGQGWPESPAALGPEIPGPMGEPGLQPRHPLSQLRHVEDMRTDGRAIMPEQAPCRRAKPRPGPGRPLSRACPATIQVQPLCVSLRLGGLAGNDSGSSRTNPTRITVEEGHAQLADIHACGICKEEADLGRKVCSITYCMWLSTLLLLLQDWESWFICSESTQVGLLHFVAEDLAKEDAATRSWASSAAAVNLR